MRPAVGWGVHFFNDERRIMKKKKPAKKPEKIKYICRWCDKEKTEDKFFKCAITHGSFICMDCIKRKYNEVNEKCEKYIAILICSHLQKV